MFVLSRVRTSRAFIKHLSRTIFDNHSVNLHKNYLNVEINGNSHNFPFVWLRDNCQCENCFHRSAKSRTIDWGHFNIQIKPKDVARIKNAVQVIWEDGHKSEYSENWLKIRSFEEHDQKKYTATIYKPAKIKWKGNEFKNICSKHDYNDVLKSDEALFNFLEKLSIYGVALIHNTPNTEHSLDAVVNKIGFTKRTHYGVKFVVQHVENTSNVAYLSNNLQMHTDLPYYEYCPGVNMLHCLVQTERNGGENLLSDCHYVADYMKKEYPKEYRLLCETEVEWSDIGTEHGNDFFKLYRAPVIVLDKRGEIVRINFSIPQRGNYFPGPIEDVQPWYEAHGLFLKLNHEFSAKFKSQAGDILVFDNIRLLHGRNAYDDQSNNVRKLIGTYIDWDEIYSRLRCLKVKLRNEGGLV